MNTMKIDQKYGNNRIAMLIKHWRLLKRIYSTDFKELIKARASMLGSIYRKKRIKGKM